jgi:hypothetical protein
MRAGCGGWLSLFAAASARAQTVHATIVSREGLAPVAGAMISLRDSADQSVDLGLSDRRGKIRLTARTPGRFSLVIQRIGAPEERSPAFGLDSALVLSYEHRVGPLTPVDSTRVRTRTASRIAVQPGPAGIGGLPVRIRSVDGAPISDAQLLVTDDSGTVRRMMIGGDDGVAFLARPLPAAGLLTIRRMGWQPTALRVDSSVGAAASIEAVLVPAPAPLTAVTIRAGHPLQRFYGMNPRAITGRVLWPDQVEGLSPSAGLPDILRATGMASVIAYPIGAFGEYCYAMRFRLGGPQCMPIYLDGLKVDRTVVIDRPMVHSVAILRPIDATLLFGMNAPDGAILIFSTAVWGDRVPPPP